MCSICMGYQNSTSHTFVPIFTTVDGSWGSWAPWSACSATCGYGSRERKRVCDNPKPAYNGKSCVGIGHQKSRCHAYYPCPGTFLFPIFSIIFYFLNTTCTASFNLAILARHLMLREVLHQPVHIVKGASLAFYNRTIDLLLVYLSSQFAFDHRVQNLAFVTSFKRVGSFAG